MGTFRMLLALAVVAGHAGKTSWMIEPRIAVQLFYIVSGFYMALVLNEKYIGPGSYRLFLSNRLLRLFPAYWLVLLLSVALCRWAGRPGDQWTLDAYKIFSPEFTPLTWAFLILANAGILGQDLTLYLGLAPETGRLYFTASFLSTAPFVQRFLFVPQAWSLSLELLFYTLAPFLVRGTLWLPLGVAAGSLGLRAFLAFHLGLNHEPWTYRFFPSELALFLAGALAYRVLKRTDWPKSKTALAAGAAFPILGVFLFSGVWREGQWARLALFYGAISLCIPLAFKFTWKMKLDRFIGELSYPVYLVHLLVIWLLSAHPGIWSRFPAGSACALSIVAAVMIHAVCLPLERYRERRSRRGITSEPEKTFPIPKTSEQKHAAA